MSMKLYDKDIACVMQNIKAYGECRTLDNNTHWKMNDKEKLVLRSDTVSYTHLTLPTT